MSQYFGKPFEPFGGDINVKVDLSNYATKTYLKNVSHVYVSSFAVKSNLSSLETEVDKLDIDKLVPIPVDLSKLSDVVKNDVARKIEYKKLVKKQQQQQKNKYENDGSDFEDIISNVYKKVPDVNGLVKKTDFSSKISEVEGKIHSNVGLATNSELTAVENKIPDVSSIVKKTGYNTKISGIEKKITDHDHDMITFNARLAAQTDLIRKPDFDAKLKSISDRVTLNKSKHLLVENELKNLEKFDAAYFRGKSCFDGGDDNTQDYLVFQPMYKYFKTSVKGSATYISSWESKGLSNEKISSISKYNYNQAPSLAYDNARIKLKLVEDLLKQDKITYNHGSIVNIYLVYRLSPSITSDITLENCLFSAVKLTKNLKINIYSGYGIALDSKGSSSRPSGGYGKNGIILGAHLSSSAHANNRVNNVLVLSKDFIQGINCTTIYAEKMYSANFTVTNKKVC